MSTPQPAPSSEPVHTYPGGEDAPSYRWAFTVWLVLFLGVLCLGLVNYLAIYAKTKWPNL